MVHTQYKFFVSAYLLCFCFFPAQAQLGKLIKKADSSFNQNQKNIVGKQNSAFSAIPPTKNDIQSGLKQALQKGLQDGVNQISVKDGFLKNPAIMIIFPPEAKKMETTLRELGLGHLCDDVIQTMNHAAEDACKKAIPIFLSALNQMSFKDGLGILKGRDNAATEYFQNITSESLKRAFRPQVDSALSRVNANFYWNKATTTYNKVPFVNKVNTDLGDYVTNQAIIGLFFTIAQEELKIRRDINARTTPLMKKVFGFADTAKQ